MDPLRCAGVRCNFIYVNDECDLTKVTIRDLGGADYPSVTNDAERVIRHLHEVGIVRRQHIRVLYYDSDGRLDELLHDGNGLFVGFGLLNAPSAIG